jgi:hypothetical protein
MDNQRAEKLLAAKKKLEILIDIKDKLERLNELKRIKRSLERIIENYTAIIIEPRKHRALEFVLRNVLDNLNEKWSVQIFHGTENEEWLKGILEKSFEKDMGRITLKNLGVSNLGTAREYSEILTSRSFTEAIPTETFLVFQTDSMINPAHKNLLEKFLEYDYVGAPWKTSIVGVGNGGFSLRKRSVMLKIIDTFGPLKGDHEDSFFSIGCARLRAYVPTKDEAKEFSIETVYSPASFGIHRAWAYHPDKIKELCDGCEGLETLIQLQ